VIERGFVRPLETVSDLVDSFRLIRELARAHLLSHLSSVSDGGIFRKAENSHLGHNSRGSTFGVPVSSTCENLNESIVRILSCLEDLKQRTLLLWYCMLKLPNDGIFQG
jgi:hypothetical protein